MKIIRISAVWCPGCLSMKKIWKDIENSYPNITMIKYDYDIDADTVSKYNPGKILPVTIFMKGDEEVARLIGEQSKDNILKEIEKCK